MCHASLFGFLESATSHEKPYLRALEVMNPSPSSHAKRAPDAEAISIASPMP
jgi:hypothetical protein